MYVICAGMYRACSTWQYNVASTLVERHRTGERIGFLDWVQFPRYVQSHPTDDLWRVLKTHDACEPYEAILREGRGVVIYAIRDLRDVAYSFMYKAAVDFDRMIRDRFLETVLANDLFWRSAPNVICQRYESLIEDPRQGVEQMAAFLKIDLAEGEAAEIAALYSRDENSRRTEEIAARLRASGVDLNDPSNAFQHDSHTLLHWNHLRTGRVGRWREETTDRHRGILGGICADWLVENGYETDGRWATPTAELLGRLRETETSAGALQAEIAVLVERLQGEEATAGALRGEIASLLERLEHAEEAASLLRGQAAELGDRLERIEQAPLRTRAAWLFRGVTSAALCA